jgi:hypothetical protein
MVARQTCASTIDASREEMMHVEEIRMTCAFLVIRIARASLRAR